MPNDSLINSFTREEIRRLDSEGFDIMLKDLDDSNSRNANLASMLNIP